MSLMDDDLDRRLLRADSARDIELSDDVVDSFSSALREAVRSARPTRSRRSMTIAGLGLVVLLVGTPAIAVGVNSFFAQTSSFPRGGGEVIAGSEWIDLSASDLGEYIASVYPQWLPLPPGMKKSELLAQVTTEMASFGDGMMQEVGIQRRFEELAFRGWLSEYLGATEVDDEPRAESPLAGLRAVPGCPAYAATDGGAATTTIASLIESIASGDGESAQMLAQMEQLEQWDGVDRSQQIQVVYCDALRRTGTGTCDDGR